MLEAHRASGMRVRRRGVRGVDIADLEERRADQSSKKAAENKVHVLIEKLEGIRRMGGDYDRCVNELLPSEDGKTRLRTSLPKESEGAWCCYGGQCRSYSKKPRNKLLRGGSSRRRRDGRGC